MVELTEIDGLGPSTSKALRDQGIDDVADLAEADAGDLDVPVGDPEQFVSQARQMTVQTKSVADLAEEFEAAVPVSTGVPELDELLGGGWEPGTIGMLYGRSGKGKSQVTFSTMVQGAAEGPVAYLQTEMESKSVGVRMRNLAEDPSVLENITVYDINSLTEQRDAYESVEQEFDDLSLLVIDSFTAQFRIGDEFTGRQNLGGRSEVIGVHLQRVGELCKWFDCPVVMTGQVYGQPEQYAREELWGGDKLKHFVSYFIRMSSGKGNLVQATVENHPGLGGGEVQLLIDDEEIVARIDGT